MNIRQIKFDGRFSLLDFGVYIGSEIDTDTHREKARPRITRENIPFMNGSYDFSRISGKVIYDDQRLYYTFIISEKTKELVSKKADELDAWLSSGAGELYDSLYPGWKFVGVSYEGMSEIQYYSYNENKGRVTVEFTSSPYLRSTTGKLIDCTTFTPNADPTLYLCDCYAAGQQGATPNYYLTRMTAQSGTSFFPSMMGASTVGDDYVQYTYTTQSGLARHWLGIERDHNGYVFTLEAVSGGRTSGHDNSYSYIGVEQASITVKVKATLNGETASGSTISGLIANMRGCYSAGSPKSWSKTLIPSLEHMRIISEGSPSLAIDNTLKDITDFELPLLTMLKITNAKSEPCKLQYCTIKERR